MLKRGDKGTGKQIEALPCVMILVASKGDPWQTMRCAIGGTTLITFVRINRDPQLLTCLSLPPIVAAGKYSQ